MENSQHVCRIQLSQCFLWKNLKITGAVVLFEGLLGSVEFPELLEKEQSDSIANLSSSVQHGSSAFLESKVVPASLLQCGFHLIPGALQMPGILLAAAACCVSLSLLWEEEEESQIVVVDYSRYWAGKNKGGVVQQEGLLVWGLEHGLRSCIDPGTGLPWGTRECGSIEVQRSLVAVNHSD